MSFSTLYGSKFYAMLRAEGITQGAMSFSTLYGSKSASASKRTCVESRCHEFQYPLRVEVVATPRTPLAERSSLSFSTLYGSKVQKRLLMHRVNEE